MTITTETEKVFDLNSLFMIETCGAQTHKKILLLPKMQYKETCVSGDYMEKSRGDASCQTREKGFLFHDWSVLIIGPPL